MKHAIVPLLLCSLLLTACNNEGDKNQLQSAVITERSVWKGDLDQCRDTDSAEKCFIDAIEKSGNADALQAARYLLKKGEMGYVSAYRKEGPVGIADIEYPFRANTNSGTLLVPSEGEPIDADAIDDITDAFADMQAFENRNPDAAPWAPGELISKEQKEGGQEFIFSYPLRTCHACETLASLQVGYSFDAEGRFIEARAVKIE